jgi:N-acetylglucosaminyl-diphospho-decaprenol L-rhamnosyltransferase
MADVAVVIPNYNGVGLVGRCVVAAREAGAAEIVVVDDASTDDSLAEAEAAGARVLVSPGTGFSAAVNAGVAATSARFVLPLNSDCFVDGSALDALSAALEQDESIGICGANMTDVDGSPAKSYGALISLANALNAGVTGRGGRAPDAAARGVQRVAFVPLACALLRRSDWERVDGLDDGYVFYFEDHDLCWRLTQLGRGPAICWDAHAIHIGGASSSDRDPQRWFRQYHESRARYLRKRYPRGWFIYALLWPPLAFAHAARRLARGGPDGRSWAAAYAAAATAGLGPQASSARQAASKSSS